ncbi:L-type lectin-domain containing receptor kinase IX.1-like [Prosopis cineraria]|uniref:L-type lectin-domain containing receptor kinase IX.1-like n=1 Tax=Prosopis cineraria TaxID=364024 RepID=UPI00240FE658|nr:L-type lectin-domain containing receptor kinase IX.1-like [Prosopis cineraria]
MGISQHWRSKNHVLLSLFITKILLLLIIPAAGATSITFNYEKFLDTANQSLNLEGDVFQENGMLNLTRYKKDSAGRVTYSKLLQLWDNETRTLANFTTRFSFIINALNKTRDGIGDGITFFLAHPDFPLPVPPDGTGIGLVGRREMKDPNYPNEHPFVAVEFDTFPNVDEGDPPYDHVGINVKQMWTPYTTQWYTKNDGRKYDAEISYNSSSYQLTVNFAGFKDNASIQQDYSHKIDLREYLPEQVQFGFSSSTGLQFELHTLSSWSFNANAAILGVVNKGKSNKQGLIIGLSIGSVVVIAGLCIAWFLIWKFNCRAKKNHDGLDLSLDEDFESVGPKKFSYNELVRATDHFAEEHKLGEGGFGGVYKGFLRGLNTYVAIKKVSQESKQGVKEYASEVKIISQLRHRNLVQLMGWCHEKNDFLLIYEFMPNGSLDYHLFQSRNLLTGPTRYNIAQGLAAAILYLHEEWQQCVVHRDIKSSNIMLDSNFNTKLGDFGLARIVEHGKGLTTTIAAGTKGYMAPECLAMGKATKESDMYSFGVVALELACGRKPIDPNASDEQFMMVEWVWELYGRGELLEAIDKRLDNGDFDEQELERLMILGLWCAHPDYTMRPTIRQALHVLNFEAPLPTLPPVMPKPVYVAPTFSDIGSSNFSSGYASSAATNQARPSPSNRSYTGSSQSSTSGTHQGRRKAKEVSL